jgi:hypothetical protein
VSTLHRRLLLAIPPVASLMSVLSAIRSGDTAETAVGVGVVMFVAAIYGGVIFPMRYGIGAERLTVRFGLFRQHKDWTGYAVYALSVPKEERGRQKGDCLTSLCHT